MISSIVIVGGNMAGGRAAEALRQHGYDGCITLVGEEPHLPYERPALSKELLWDKGALPPTFFLRDDNWYADNRINLRLGNRAEAIDMAARRVTLVGGESLPADRILLATGGRPRRLPLQGADTPNVHHLRNKDDADRLAEDLIPGAHIVVVGMGVIGAEVAASARKLGCKVTAIEPAPVPMIRTLGTRFGGWLAQRHADEGVHVFYGRSVARLRVEDRRVYAVELDDGATIKCDAVVVGIGIVPATELADAAGIAVGNGIIVDGACRTSHAELFAAGDVAEQPHFFGGRVRLETFQNAADQGAAAAAAMLGQDIDHVRPCWFWTDQYDLNIQAAGRIDDRLDIIVRGDMRDTSFAAFYLDDGVVSGAITVNRATDMGVGRRLVERRASVEAGALADPATSLRDILKAATRP